MNAILTALHQHPGTCAILALYAGNVAWYLYRNHWGLAVYWSAAATITIAATWLRDWGAS